MYIDAVRDTIINVWDMWYVIDCEKHFTLSVDANFECYCQWMENCWLKYMDKNNKHCKLSQLFQFLVV